MGFSELMTSFLGQATLTGYFAAIIRRDLDLATYTGLMPVLAVYATDQADGQEMGDGAVRQNVNYRVKAASTLASGSSQDVLLDEMASRIKTAVDGFSVAGRKVEVRRSNWDAVELLGSAPKDKAWLQLELTFDYME